MAFCFLSGMEDEGPSPSCGCFEFPGTALTKCSDARKVRGTF